MPPHGIMPPPQKSLLGAIALEYGLPGAGAIYAGQVRTGVIWLMATLPSTGLFVALMFISAIGYAGNFAVITLATGLLLGFALILWLVVRLALVGSYVKEFNDYARWRRRQCGPGS